MENIDPILVENLHVPNLDRNNQQMVKDSKIGEKFRKFNQELRAIFENFSDFKKQDNKIYEHDLYFKLIAKQIIFIIKVPSKELLQKKMMQKTQQTIRVEFFVLKKKMIKLSQRLKDNRINKFLTKRLDSIYATQDNLS